jgi:hypothetical protein
VWGIHWDRSPRARPPPNPGWISGGIRPPVLGLGGVTAPRPEASYTRESWGVLATPPSVCTHCVLFDYPTFPFDNRKVQSRLPGNEMRKSFIVTTINSKIRPSPAPVSLCQIAFIPDRNEPRRKIRNVVKVKQGLQTYTSSNHYPPFTLTMVNVGSILAQ